MEFTRLTDSASKGQLWALGRSLCGVLEKDISLTMPLSL